MPQRPLGRLQLIALNHLASRHSGTWERGCDWQIGSPGETERILDSLVERDMATRTSASRRYTITEEGLNHLGWYSCHTCPRLTMRPHRGHFLGVDRYIRCSECYAMTTVGPCEHCTGACQGFHPGPRVRAGHLKVSRACHDLLFRVAVPERASRRSPVPEASRRWQTGGQPRFPRPTRRT
ncbi:hypothetical protein ACFV9E_06595 [Streptomyces sp. NPDC059835]|uniref:hypothetical protein n=1 Tax=Streptomyces sp. NPDC059835 TaxID=3346967 RepID=UPI00364D4D86